MNVDEPIDEALFRWAIEGSRLVSAFPYQETLPCDHFSEWRPSAVEEAPQVDMKEGARPMVGSDVIMGQHSEGKKEEGPK